MSQSLYMASSHHPTHQHRGMTAGGGVLGSPMPPLHTQQPPQHQNESNFDLWIAYEQQLCSDNRYGIYFIYLNCLLFNFISTLKEKCGIEALYCVALLI